MEQITITGELLFQFYTFSQWVNHASSWYKPYKSQPTITLDKNNNVCHIGADFMSARKNDLFPIRVYRLQRSALS